MTKDRWVFIVTVTQIHSAVNNSLFARCVSEVMYVMISEKIG